MHVHTTTTVGRTLINGPKDLRRRSSHPIRWEEELAVPLVAQVVPRYLLARGTHDATWGILDWHRSSVFRRDPPTLPDTHRQIFAALRTGAQLAMAELRIGQYFDPGNGSSSGITGENNGQLRTDVDDLNCRIPRWEQVRVVPPEEWKARSRRYRQHRRLMIEDIGASYSYTSEVIGVAANITPEDFFVTVSHEIGHAMSMHIFAYAHPSSPDDDLLWMHGLGLYFGGQFLGLDEGATERLAERIRKYAAPHCCTILPQAETVDRDQSYTWQRSVMDLLHQNINAAAGLPLDHRGIEDVMLRSKLSGDFRYHRLLFKHFGRQVFDTVAAMGSTSIDGELTDWRLAALGIKWL